MGSAAFSFDLIRLPKPLNKWSELEDAHNVIRWGQIHVIHVRSTHAKCSNLIRMKIYSCYLSSSTNPAFDIIIIFSKEPTHVWIPWNSMKRILSRVFFKMPTFIITHQHVVCCCLFVRYLQTLILFLKIEKKEIYTFYSLRLLCYSLENNGFISLAFLFHVSYIKTWV